MDEGRGRAAGALLLAAVLLAGAAGEPRGTFQRGALGSRAYRLYVPSRALAAPTSSLPLVVALHGCWQTPEDFAAGTRLNAAAEERGLLVLYPAQGRRDNPSRCWNWFEPAHLAAGEVGEILALIDQVGRQQRVARDRIVTLGLSAGGFMAVNLVCAAPDVVSGVGVVAAGPYRCATGAVGALECMRGHRVDGEASARACRTTMGRRARIVRASLWHGADDTVVSPANFDALTVMFARLAAPAGSRSERREGALHTVYRDARGQTVLESWLVAGMGHAWSGGHPRGSLTWPPGPSATERMLDFLLPPASPK